MITIDDVAPRAHYIAVTGQTPFQVPFEWMANEDLYVFVNGIECTFDDPPLDAMHYRTIGAGLEGGGSIEFGPPGRLNGDEVIIYRDMPIASPIDFPTVGLFPTASLNDAFDKQTAMIQQADTNVYRRSLRMFHNDFLEIINPIPDTQVRKGKLLGFDADGHPTVLGIEDLPSGGGGGGGGIARVWTDDDPPPMPVDGDLWWESDTGTLYVWYQDVDSGQWVQASGGSSSGAVTVLTPELFGARGDGLTDDTASIQAAINAAGAAPCGDVYLAGKTYKISQTLDVPYPNVSIVGAGGDVHHTIAPQGAQASTKLKWAGAHGGTMMHIRSPEGASLQALTGGGVKGVYFDSGVVSGADGAGIGIRISSRRNGWYEDVFFRNFQDVGFLLDCVSSLGDDRGCHHNMFMLCGSRNTSDNMDGGFVRLYGDPGPIPGEPTNCNVYGNTFMSCRPVFNTGTCFDLYNCDHNNFIGCFANRQTHTFNAVPFTGTISIANPCIITSTGADGLGHDFITGHAMQFEPNSDTLPAPLAFNTGYYVTQIDANTFKISTTLANRIAGVFISTAGGSQSGTHKLNRYGGKGILFHGSNNAGCIARANHFVIFSGGDEIHCQGTSDGVAFPSFHNMFNMLDYSNYTPLPTAGTGATFTILSRDDGTQPQGKFIAPSFGGPSLNVETTSLLMEKVQARMTTETMRIASGLGDQIRMELPASDYESVLAEWGIGVISGGNLRIARFSGTGVITTTAGMRFTSTTAGVGYGTGAGSTIVQGTSKSTVIGLNRVCGLITSHDASLAANTAVTFQMNNSACELGDVVIVNHDPIIGGTVGAYVLTGYVAAGHMKVTIRNATAGALAEAIGIRFAIFKAVTA